MKSHDLQKSVYEPLGIDLNKLGCVMLDLDEKEMPAMPTGPRSDYVYSKKYKWVNGYTANKNPHVTLLYGLLHKDDSTYVDSIDAVLAGWDIPDVTIKGIEVFDSPWKDVPYYCIVGLVDVTPELEEAHKMLSFLPHINTYMDYKPHVTFAYVKKDKDIRDKMVKYFEEKVKGKSIRGLEISTDNL